MLPLSKLALILAAFTLTSAATADVVTTRDGRTLTGVVRSATVEGIVIVADATEYRVDAAEVRAIEFDNKMGPRRAVDQLRDKWRQVVLSTGSCPTPDALGSELSRMAGPATLALLDSLLVEGSSELVVFSPEDPAEPVGRFDTQLLMAMHDLRWWRWEQMACELTRAEICPETRSAAIDLLATDGTPRCLEALAQCLTSDDPVVGGASAAIAAQAARGYFAEAMAAVRPLTSHADTQVRCRAWASLSGGSFASAGTMLDAGLRDNDAMVRREVVAAAAGATDRDTVELLVHIAEHDPDPAVALLAIRAVGRSSVLATFPQILELGEATEDAWQTDAAIQALTQLSGADYGNLWDRWHSWWESVGQAKSATQDAQPTLQEQLDIVNGGGEPDERARALLALASRPAALSSESLVTIASRESSPLSLRIAALEALERRGETSYAGSLAEIMRATPCEDLKPALAHALTAFTGADLGISGDQWVRYVDLLSRRSDRDWLVEDAREWVNECKDDPELVTAAIHLVGKRQLSELVDVMIQLASSEDQPIPIRRDSIRAVGELPFAENPAQEETIARLSDILENEDPVLATAALASLRKIVGADLGSEAAAWRNWTPEGH